MWKHDAPQGNESSKTRWRAVPFIRGTGLDIGCGREKLMDTQFVIGIDDNSDLGRFNIQANANIYMDCKDFGRFSSGAYDFAFSSHLLEHFYYKDVPAVLREWMRVVRMGGTLCFICRMRINTQNVRSQSEISLPKIGSTKTTNGM